MATPDRTVESSIRNYPSLFETRADVLLYLFAVIGNGHGWVNGELVSYSDEPEYTDEEVQHVCPPEWVQRAKDGDATYAQTVADWDARNAHLLEVRRTASERARDKEAGLVRMVKGYPESEYALLKSVPENVTPEWAAVAEEARALIEPLWAKKEA